jgi:hypothetical protein
LLPKNYSDLGQVRVPAGYAEFHDGVHYSWTYETAVGTVTKLGKRKRTARDTDLRTSARALEHAGRYAEPDWQNGVLYLNRAHGHGSQRFPGSWWTVRGPNEPMFWVDYAQWRHLMGLPV